jgi:hypothetical protein
MSWSFVNSRGRLRAKPQNFMFVNSDICELKKKFWGASNRCASRIKSAQPIVKGLYCRTIVAAPCNTNFWLTGLKALPKKFRDKTLAFRKCEA